MQYIIASFIIGVFVGICIGYGALYGGLNELKKQYSKDVNTLQDELNYYSKCIYLSHAGCVA